MRKRDPFGCFHREAAAAPGHHVDGEMGVFPVLVPGCRHPQGTAGSRPGTFTSPRRLSASELRKSPSGKHIGDDPSQQPPD